MNEVKNGRINSNKQRWKIYKRRGEEAKKKRLVVDERRDKLVDERSEETKKKCHEKEKRNFN